MHHSCGDVEPIISDMLEIGLQVLHPIQPHAMSLEKLADAYGETLTFHGGIDTQHVLPFGSPEEVKREVERCVKILGEKGTLHYCPFPRNHERSTARKYRGPCRSYQGISKAVLEPLMIILFRTDDYS